MKLAEALRDLVTHLTEDGVEFALVGGLAASARGEARFTRDVDIAVSVADDEQAESVVYLLSNRGYVVVTTVEQEATGRLATARLLHSNGVVCDLVFATPGVEAEVVETATMVDVFSELEVPTASPEALLAMKTLSATEQRPRDLEDLRAILDANPGYEEATVLDLLTKVASRGCARGQNLVEKWAALRSRFGR